MSPLKLTLTIIACVVGTAALSAIAIFVCLKMGVGTKVTLSPGFYAKHAETLTVWNNGCVRLTDKFPSLRKALFIDFAYPWQAANDESTAISEKIASEYSNDYERALAVYRWVTQNIAYDKDYEPADIFTKRQTLADVLQNRCAVCTGFSYLTAALLRSMNIPAKVVVGYVNETDTPHVWNEACIDGVWITVDTSWDAVGERLDGVVDHQKYKPRQRYFDMPYAEFYSGRIVTTCSNSVFEVALVSVLLGTVALAVCIIVDTIGYIRDRRALPEA